MAELTYYIFEGVLVGFAGGGFIQIFSGSGGGAGSTKNPTAWTANSPYATVVKTKGKASSKQHEHGGPLPLGRYTIHPSSKHQKLGRACYLEPNKRTYMFGRSGFYIHGKGRHGSDGCIVPSERLPFLLDRIDRDGGGTLHVMEGMEGDRFA
jgi:hypothetical protein